MLTLHKVIFVVSASEIDVWRRILLKVLIRPDYSQRLTLSIRNCTCSFLSRYNLYEHVTKQIKYLNVSLKLKVKL